MESLSGGVDVFGLGQAGQLVLVAGQAAEEDGAADAEDGGAPAEAVSPGVVIVTLEDLLVELDWVDDQGDDLDDHCRGRRRRDVRSTHTNTFLIRKTEVEMYVNKINSVMKLKCHTAVDSSVRLIPSHQRGTVTSTHRYVTSV